MVPATQTSYGNASDNVRTVQFLTIEVEGCEDEDLGALRSEVCAAVKNIVGQRPVLITIKRKQPPAKPHRQGGGKSCLSRPPQLRAVNANPRCPSEASNPATGTRNPCFPVG